MTQSNPFAEIPARTLSPVADPVDVDVVPDEDDEAAEAQPDAATAEPEWAHETIEFKGDTLNVRKPTQQALAAFSLSTSKYVSPQMRNDMTGMFISRHMSPESYERVFSRLMDPDEVEYTIETIGQLMRAVVTLP